MEFKLKTPEVKKPGVRVFQIQFTMETVDPEFRDNVVKMILAGLDGTSLQQVEPKPPVLGFHKDDEGEDNDDHV